MTIDPKQIDTLIREGLISDAKKQLGVLSLFLKTNGQTISRDERLEFARLARRTRMPLLGIRLLHPLVRSDNVAAKPDEKAEYAANLTRMGCGAEALRLLNQVSRDSVVQVDFFKALAQISLWDYSAASHALNRYLDCSSITSYERSVGQINQAACLVFLNQFETARKLLKTLLKQVDASKNRLLAGNLLELSAQNEIFSGDLGQAQKYVTLSREIFSSQHESLELFFVDKWQWVLQLKQGRGNLESLLALKSRALALHHFESLRDLDFHYSLFNKKDLGLRKKLYWGTPYLSFRERIQHEWGFIPEKPSFFELPGLVSKCSTKSVTLFERDHVRGWKPGQVPDRLFEILAGDRYRPKRLYELFVALFEGRHYHPIYSPEVTYQALKRTRKLLKISQSGITICEDNGFYSLKSTDKTVRVFGITKEKAGLSLEHRGLLRRFSLSQKGKLFSVGDLLNQTLIPRRTASRILKQAFLGGVLAASGEGAGRKYRFL